MAPRDPNADAAFKAAFKAGCAAAGGTFGEEAEGVFFCSLPGDGQIRCTSASTACTYIPRISGHGLVFPHPNLGPTLELSQAGINKVTVQLTPAGLNELLHKGQAPAPGDLQHID